MVVPGVTYIPRFQAKSPTDAEEGLLFMQEMVELSKLQSQEPEVIPQAVTFPMRASSGAVSMVTLQAGPAHFGPMLDGGKTVTAPTVIIKPFNGCLDPLQKKDIVGKIAVMERGDCIFVEKARKVQKAGAVGAIIVDDVPGTSAQTSPMFSMSGDGTNDVKIPTVFLFNKDASKLITALTRDPTMLVCYVWYFKISTHGVVGIFEILFDLAKHSCFNLQ